MTGERATRERMVTAPTSHIDLLPTLLGAAGIDQSEVAEHLAPSFSEFHPLPGRDLSAVVAGAEPDTNRAVYLQTRDNIFEADALPSALALLLRLGHNPPPALRVSVAAGVGSSVEGVVVRLPEGMVPGGAGHLWKLVRTFDDPDTWTEPGTRHLDSSGLLGETHRATPLDDQWELYDLTEDPVESRNRWHDIAAAEVRDHLLLVLDEQRTACVPPRNTPWPYRPRRPPDRRLPWPGDLIGRVLRVGD